MALLAHVAATLMVWHGRGLDLSLSFFLHGGAIHRIGQVFPSDIGSAVGCMLDSGSVLVVLQVALADVVSVFSHAVADATQEGKDGFCDISEGTEAYSSL